MTNSGVFVRCPNNRDGSCSMSGDCDLCHGEGFVPAEVAVLTDDEFRKIVRHQDVNGDDTVDDALDELGVVLVRRMT